ncbi:MAG: ATP-binding protein [Bdellovibrionota bacterium]
MRKQLVFGSFVLIIANLLLGTSVYFAFDKAITKIAQDTMDNWHSAEINSITEGNLLTSVAGNQKLLLSSEFLKGGVVFAVESGRRESLLSFGIPIDIQGISLSDFSMEEIGILRKIVTRKIAGSANLYVSFQIFSPLALNFLWVSISILGLIINGALISIAAIQHREHLRRENQRGLFLEVAAAAIHDVQSPLMSLNHLSADETLQPEVRSHLTSIANSISVILNDLNGRRKDTPLLTSQHIHFPAKEDTSDAITIDVARQILNLKAASFAPEISCIIKDCSTMEFAIPLSQVNFNRCISNFLDNSVESMAGPGQIEIILRNTNTDLQIEIIDSGTGIPKEKLSRVGELGFTWNKNGGSGMGFYSAQKVIRAAGGTCILRSEVGKGTSVAISFPLASPKRVIQIENGEKVLILDDDHSVLATWKRLMQRDLPLNIGDIHYFSEVEVFSNFISKLEKEKVTVFCDFDLKLSGIDGLSLAKKRRSNHRFILLTGHAEDHDVQKRSSALGIRVIPKNVFSQIQISVS